MKLSEGLVGFQLPVLGEEIGTAKLSRNPLKGHDEDAAKKQHAGSVKAQDQQ